jgi:hypothetical protein
MTGPLRPSIEYVIWFCNDIKKRIPNCKLYILYWETTEEDKKKLETIFDKVFSVPEPRDTDLWRFITARTLQQIQLKGAYEFVTPRIYKLFYGIRCIIDKLDLSNSDIVMRIRTDGYIARMDTLHTPGPNQFLYCPKVSCGNACDWFGISTFETLKKLYYTRDNAYNKAVANSWNPEDIIINNARMHGVEMVSINSTTRLAIAREYSPLKLHYYD